MQGIGWLILFIADLIFDLVSIYFRWNDLRYITKPLLTILLGVYSFQLLRSAPFLLLFILTALGLSGAGDVFLLFEGSQPVYFLLGLTSFLFAHFCYILLFIRIGKINRSVQKYFGWPVLPVLLYTSGLFLLILPGLGVLKIPVLIYACTLSGMLISCITVFDFSKKTGKYCITGAILFVFSDSLLAVNKFYHPLPQAGLLIMLTYAMAQFFIVTGICQEIDTRSSAKTADHQVMAERNI